MKLETMDRQHLPIQDHVNGTTKDLQKDESILILFVSSFPSNKISQVGPVQT